MFRQLSPKFRNYESGCDDDRRDFIVMTPTLPLEAIGSVPTLLAAPLY